MVTEDHRQLRSHKFLLTGCSSFFQEVLLSSSSCQTIYLRGVSGPDLECLLEYLYLGQTEVPPHRLQQFLEVARDLGVADLSDLSHRKSAETEEILADNVTDQIAEADTKEAASDVPADNIAMTPATRDVSFECPECGARFSRNASMRSHFRSKHKGVQYPYNYNPYTNTTTSTTITSIISTTNTFMILCMALYNAMSNHLATALLNQI